MSKIKSCTIINPPNTTEEKDSQEIRLAKALASALYRSLSEDRFKQLLNELQRKGGKS